MRLSDAIALGRMILKPLRGHLIEGEAGCALGMAGKAAGVNMTGFAYDRITKTWPWLETFYAGIMPCGCPTPGLNNGGVIIHFFDWHVIGYRDMTLDNLIAWVRENEPAEPVAEAEPAASTPDGRVLV